MNDQGKGTPGWLILLFAVVVGGGALYAIFQHGFLGDKTQAQILRESTGRQLVQAEVSTQPERTAQAIANGKTTYSTVCAACHGMNMEGIVGPSLSDGTWLHANNEKDLVRIVTKGIGPGETKAGAIPMPAKGGRPDLSDEQIWEVLYYISSKNATLQQSN